MSDNRENLLNKIRALMSKTTENGCTHEEEMAALAKAKAMMDAYEVSDDELRLTKEERAVFRREPPGTQDPHGIKQRLAVAVAKFCECRVWIDNRQGGGALVFCGLRPDAQFATWLLDHLAQFVQAELANHLMTDLSAGRRERNAVVKGFVQGCTARVSERLQELCTQSQPQTSNARALVVVKGQAINDRMAAEGIKVRTKHSTHTMGDAGAYASGKAAGDRASFGRPVSGSNGTLRIGGR